ncbi:Histone acetyltransferase HAC1 [Spatholobus suberectus]|nr:Histone acetyltransferase HAC1 [Spatholobus suberectus]
MHAKGSNLGNTRGQIPGNSSSFVPNLPPQIGLDLRHQYNVNNQVGYFSDWRKDPGISHCRNLIRNKISAIFSYRFHYEQEQASVKANILENWLFIDAASQEEYMNQGTLMKRLETQLNKLHATKCNQQVDCSITYSSKMMVPSSGLLHARSNRSVLEPAFQKVAGPINNATDYCAVAVDNKYGFPKGGLSHSSIVPEPVFSPDNCSSITTCTDMDVLSNFSVSGGGSNLEASSKSICSYFPQQQADNWEMNLIKYGDCSGAMQKNDSMAFITTMGKSLQSESSNLLIPQHVSREFSEVSSVFPGLSSLGHVRQYQHQKLDFQQNLEHFMQPYVLHGKTYMAQPNSCFVNQGEHCHQMLGQKTLKQQQLFTSLNGDEQFTSESSAYLFGSDGSANMNSCSSSKVSVEQRILLEYFYYKNLNIVSRDNVIKYLHSTVCCKGICNCEWNSKLLLHFDNCQGDDCHICYSWKLCGTDILERHLEFPNSVIKGSVVRKNDAPSGNSEAMLPPAKRRKTESAFGVSLINNTSLDRLTHKMVQPCSSEALSQLQQQPESPPSSGVTECNVEQFTNPMLDSISNSEKKSNVIDYKFGQTFKNETIISKSLEADHISEEPDPKSHDVNASSNFEDTVIRLNSNMPTLCKEPMPADIEEPDPKSHAVKASSKLEETVIRSNFIVHTLYKEPMLADIEEPDPKSHDVKDNSNLEETVIRLNSNMHTLYKEPMPADIEEPDPKSHDVRASSNLEEAIIRSNSDMHTLCKEPMPADIEDIHGRTRFSQDGINAAKKVVEAKADQEKETKSPNPTLNTVSLTDFFTINQIREHIKSLRKQFNESTTVEEPGIDVYKCQLCAMGALSFAPVPIYCFCCAIRIKRNACYYYRKEEDGTQHCFCTVCYKNSRGGIITFNGTSVSKTDLDKKTNNREFEEAWVECNKCKSWQHQICALYNDKRDLDYSAEYTCPICRLKEIRNGMHVPLPKTAMFGAKDLPRTMLSDHIEKRLFKRLMQESEDWAKVEGNKNLDEVLVAENLSVRVVLSVDKQLKVKKQFLDIFVEENYPAEFTYTSKVILLFQQIEGVDVCLFAMYVQEFGSECGYPNQRCVYISYLDSVKYFRPERETMSGEALRTFVYHEILIGYLDFCKKRGFTTCYIWACPPVKGEDYILYCHPDTQKTPKKDKLRHWYHSMLRKAAEENIVVGLTNIYDHFFVPTGNCDSKVTATSLPYFDGDFWSGAAMDKARIIEQESGGEYESMLKKLVTKRTLKAMGHVNPSKGTAKDILVMQKLGQTIFPFKEDFIIVQFQYVCIHCHEVIESGKRWFCTECKKFQECERCHTADSHTSVNGDKHTLCQVLMDDILCDTKENDIILDNGLFDTRHNFLSFCQRNRFQFDSLRRAKYSSMMILYFLKNPTLLTVGTMCSICCKDNVYQCYWKCENCPEFIVCSACYNERGANCHAHTLSQTCSTTQCPSGNQELKQKSVLMQELLDVIKHASQCHSTKTQPCTYRHCLQIKKLFSHASRCTIRVSGGCQYCKKVWQGLAIHSRHCRDSGCRIPRCMDLKKQAEWIATQSESRRRAAYAEGCRELSVH